MVNREEDRQKLTEMLDKLKSYRTDLVRLDMQMSQLRQKERLLKLDVRKVESAKVLEVDQARDSKGNSLCRDVEVKRALVEDLLAQDERFTALMHKHNLLLKHLRRKTFKADTLRAKISDLEAREKVLVLT